MSNETMTDARALPNELDFEQWYVENAFDYERDPLGSDKCGLQRKAWHAAIARLRGEATQLTCWSCGAPYTLAQRSEADGNCPACGVEIELDAAQGEQQAVAFVAQDGMPTWLHDGRGLGASSAQPVGTMLYTRPQPAAVAGDAVHEIVSDIRQSAKVDDYEIQQIAFLESIADRLAALSAAPAAPVSDAEWMADPQTIEAKRQWNTVADILRADRDDPDSVIAAAEAAARALHGVERFQSAAPEGLARMREVRPDVYADGFVVAAPAPVAGDAVADHLRARVAELPERITGVFTLDAYEFAWLRAALAQDRASQDAAAGVPEGFALVPTHWVESLLASAGLLESTKCPIDALQAKALRKMADLLAAPTPAAEGEVR